MKADPVVQRGQQLFGQYCAGCHGPAGKGDGISGQNLPIKPQDLTVGAQLNPLPDRSCSTSSLTVPSRSGCLRSCPASSRISPISRSKRSSRYVRTLAEPTFNPNGVLPVPAKREGPVQPIFFSHLIHAGSMQIACQYCHADARRSSSAGIPSVERCMGCHKIIAAEGNPEVTKLHGYWERKEPIPWVRVFKVPEFANFTHKPHVQAGVQCQTCHGRIEAMERVSATTGQNLPNDLLNLTGMNVPPTKLTMGWCVECHRSVNVKRSPRDPEHRDAAGAVREGSERKRAGEAERAARMRDLPPLSDGADRHAAVRFRRPPIPDGRGGKGADAMPKARSSHWQRSFARSGQGSTAGSFAPSNPRSTSIIAALRRAPKATVEIGTVEAPGVSCTLVAEVRKGMITRVKPLPCVGCKRRRLAKTKLKGS